MKTILNRATPLMMLCMVIIMRSPAGAASASAPQPLVTYSKTTVTFDQPTFTVSYGQTINLCATIKPARMATKMTWPSSPAGALTITPGTDPNCNGGSGVFLTVQSNVQACIALANVVATMNSKPVKSSVGTIILPTSEVAKLLDSGSGFDSGCDTPGIGCFYKDFAVVFPNPASGTLNLTNVLISETLTAKITCPFTQAAPHPAPASLSPSLNLWGVEDHNEVPGGNLNWPPGQSSCTDVYQQSVFVGSCFVQTNTLTYSADIFGDRSITRTDQQ